MGENGLDRNRSIGQATSQGFHRWYDLPSPRRAGGVSGDRLLRLTPDLDPKEMRDGISVTGFGGQGER